MDPAQLNSSGISSVSFDLIIHLIRCIMTFVLVLLAALNGLNKSTQFNCEWFLTGQTQCACYRGGEQTGT